MSRIFSLLIVIVLSACCAKKTTSQKMEQKQALIGKWQVENIGENKSVEKLPTLTFEDGQIHGNAGCNNYNANVTVKDNTISFGLFMKTKMYCDNMEVENAFMDKLQKVTNYKIKNNKLILFDKENNAIINCISTN